MNDLLNEDEFLPKEYNPRGWFNRFYIISSILSTVLFFSVRFLRDYFNNVTATVTIIFSFLIPIIFSMIMVLSKRDNILMLKPKKAAYKVFILFIYCYLSILLLGLVSTFKGRSLHISMLTGFLYTVVATLVLYALLYLVSIAIIIPILKRAQRINKLPQ